MSITLRDSKTGSTQKIGRVPRKGGGYETGVVSTTTRTATGGSSTIRTAGAIEGKSITEAKATQAAVEAVNQERLKAGQPALVGTNPQPLPTRNKPLPQTLTTQNTSGTVTSPILNRPVTQAEIDQGKAVAASNARIEAAKAAARAEEQQAAYNQARPALQRSNQRLGGTIQEATNKGETLAQKQADFAYRFSALSIVDPAGKSYVARAAKGALKAPQRILTSTGTTIESGTLLIDVGLTARKTPLQPDVRGAAKATAQSFDPREPENLVNIALLAAPLKGAGTTKVTRVGAATTESTILESRTRVTGRPDLSSGDVYGSFKSTAPVTVTERSLLQRIRRKPGTTTTGEVTTTGIVSGRILKQGTEFQIIGKQTTTIGTKTTTTPIEASGIGFKIKDTPVTATRYRDTVSVSTRRTAGNYQAERTVAQAPGITITTPVPTTASNIITQTASTRVSRPSLFRPIVKENLGLQTSTSEATLRTRTYTTPQEYAFTAQNLEGKQVFVRGITEKENTLNTQTRKTVAETLTLNSRAAEPSNIFRTGYKRLTGNKVSGEFKPFDQYKPNVKSSTPIFESSLMKREVRLQKARGILGETKPIDEVGGFGQQKTLSKTRSRTTTRKSTIELDAELFKPTIKNKITVPRLAAPTALKIVPSYKQETYKATPAIQFKITPTQVQRRIPAQIITPEYRTQQAQRSAQITIPALRTTPVTKTTTTVTPYYYRTPRTGFGGAAIGIPGGGGIGGIGKRRSGSGGDTFTYAPTFTAAFFGIKATKKQRKNILAGIASGKQYTGTETIRPLI